MDACAVLMDDSTGPIGWAAGRPGRRPAGRAPGPAGLSFFL